MNFFEKVYAVVKKIPRGKVTTYGEIALRLCSGSDGSRINISPRTVGWVLHSNKSASVPCHRVVNKDGRLAPNFAGPQLPGAIATGRRAFEGAEEQRRRLLAEGIGSKDKMHVDLNKHLFNI